MIKDFNKIFIIPKEEHSRTEPYKRQTDIMDEFEKITENVIWLKLDVGQIFNGVRDRVLQRMKDDLKELGYEVKIEHEITIWEYNWEYLIWVIVHNRENLK